ncbi:MAG TPA: 5-formyltetrahydrofolate cyclo-ligase [Actinocatenispora sp.]
MHAVSEKSTLRDRLSANRRDHAAESRSAADAAIRAAVRDLLRTGRSVGRPAVGAARRTVAGYVPSDGEPGGAALADVLRAWGDRVLLPVLRSDLDLDWAEYTGPDCLQPARWRLCEPGGPRLGRGAVSIASIVVVPALAVDRTGTRLGRGGGSYDRALSRVPGRTLVVALLYDGELADDALPHEAHDRRVNAVITPATGFRRIG